MRAIAAAILSLVLGLAATSAHAATFLYTLRAPTVFFGEARDVYVASGKLFATDDGKGGFDITGASGSYTIEGYPDFTRTVGGAVGTIASDGLGGLTVSNFALFEPGSDGFPLIRMVGAGSTPGTYEFDVGDGVSAPAATLTLEATAAVPEPATWGMMILGFGVVGASMRRRRPAMRTSVRFA